MTDEVEELDPIDEDIREAAKEIVDQPSETPPDVDDLPDEVRDGDIEE